MKYLVRFWYNADLRAFWKGDADDEVSAIIKAKEETLGFKNDWVTDRGFKITVEQAVPATKE